MNFAQQSKRNIKDPTKYVELGMNEVLKLQVENGKAQIVIDPFKLEKLTIEARDIVQKFQKDDFLQSMQLFTMIQYYGKGPKVFKPTSEQLFALEKMKLNITCEDFNTPYETIIIDLPKEYVEARSPIGQKLSYVTLLYMKEFRFFSSGMSFEESIYQSWWCAKADAEIEEWLEYKSEDDDSPHVKSLPVSGQERACDRLVKRAVLNYCLLLDEVGIKKCGPENPGEYAQLVKWCQKNTIHTKKNKLNLQAQPIVYKIINEQNIELVRVLSSEDQAPGEPTGRKVGPHNRRGHYRIQRYGVANALKKRIRIPAVIVNKHLLTGPIGATYKT